MSVKKNYAYNLLYQLLTVSLPLITVPYISRVLGSNGVGIYAYTSSIVQYFCLLGMLGISTYGNKSIAVVRDNRKKLSETFLGIYAIQVIMSFISLTGYFLLIFVGLKEDKSIAIIQSIMIFSTAIDCSWLFSGLEKFKKIVMRNILVKVLTLVSMFIFVKTKSDLPIYTLIMCCGTFFGQFIMWLSVGKYIDFSKVKIIEIYKHFRPTLSYFIPQIAIQIYFVLDKTMLGVLSSKSEVGIYEYADKILKIYLAFVTSLGTVMLPRMANTFSKGDFKRANKYLSYSLDFSTLIAIPIMFGLAGIAKEFIPWYLGAEFIKSNVVLIIISPTILLMSWSGVFGTQYLLALSKMRLYSISVYSGAAVNLIINLIFISKMGSIGAAIGTICAEATVTLVQLNYVKHSLDIKMVLKRAINYFFAGTVMFGAVRLLGNIMGASFLTTFLQIIIGGFIYIAILLLLDIYKREGLLYEEFSKVRNSIK